MAIALNSAPVLRRDVRRKSHSVAVLVPPAAIWDPVQNQTRAHSSSHASSCGTPGVRTLSSEGRTQGRTMNSETPFVSSRRSVSRSRRGGSNVGNYVLGAVFGAAVFIGTVWGGLSIDSEVPNAHGASATAEATSR